MSYFNKHGQLLEAQRLNQRTRFDLDKAERRAHILEGYKIALDNLDKVIKLIRGSKNPAEVKAAFDKNPQLENLLLDDFFRADGAPQEVATRRQDGFFRLAAMFAERTRDDHQRLP